MKVEGKGEGKGEGEGKCEGEGKGEGDGGDTMRQKTVGGKCGASETAGESGGFDGKYGRKEESGGRKRGGRGVV